MKRERRYLAMTDLAEAPLKYHREEFVLSERIDVLEKIHTHLPSGQVGAGKTQYVARTVEFYETGGSFVSSTNQVGQKACLGSPHQYLCAKTHQTLYNFRFPCDGLPHLVNGTRHANLTRCFCK